MSRIELDAALGEVRKGQIVLASRYERSKTARMGKGPVQLSPGNQNVL